MTILLRFQAPDIDSARLGRSVATPRPKAASAPAAAPKRWVAAGEARDAIARFHAEAAAERYRAACTAGDAAHWVSVAAGLAWIALAASGVFS